MGYRNQPTSASGVKDVSDKGPTFQDRALLENEKREAERKRLADINKKREESNWRIEQEESLYSADLQAGIRTAANKTNVDYTSLNDSMSNMVSQLSAARIRLKQSSGPYEEMDPEGNVVFNTQTDKSYIKSATDFIKNSETNFGSVAYIQEEFKKMPSGNGEGETSRKFTSPYLGLLNAASNPASGQDVSVSYDMEYDNKSGHRMGIVMKGEAVRRLNAEMGNDSDTYTIKPEEIANLMMGNNDPENFGLFYQNPSTVSELEKKAGTNGILDPKDGSITSDYMIQVNDAKKIVDELTGTEQMATVSQVNYPVIKQNMAGAIKSKLMTTLNKGMVSTSVLINTYAKQDESGNYYYDTPRKDENGNIIYKANGKVDFGNEEDGTRNRVYLGDGELEFDMSKDNESFAGLSEEDYNGVYGLIENEFMKRSGVYDPQVVKPYGEKLKFTDETGSMPEWKQTQNYKKNLADQFVNTVGEIDITDEREAEDTARMLSGIIGEGGSVSWDEEKQGFVFKTVKTRFDDDGNLLDKSAEEAVIKYNPNDPNWKGKLTQEVYNQLGVKEVAGDFKTSKTPVYLKEIPKIQIDYSTYGDNDEKAVKQINDNKALSLLLDKVDGTVKQRDGVQDGVVITYRDPSGTMIEKDIVTGAGMTDDEFQEELKSVFKEITLAAGTETSEADDDFINPFESTTQGATNTKEEVKEDQNTETDAVINASNNNSSYVDVDGFEIEGDLTPEDIERLTKAGLIKKK